LVGELIQQKTAEPHCDENIEGPRRSKGPRAPVDGPHDLFQQARFRRERQARSYAQHGGRRAAGGAPAGHKKTEDAKAKQRANDKCGEGIGGLSDTVGRSRDRKEQHQPDHEAERPPEFAAPGAAALEELVQCERKNGTAHEERLDKG
jgi:hypothetical protein